MPSPPLSPSSIDFTLELPRVLLMGLRRSGKTSIKKVVFQKMAPNETIFLESTTKMGVELVDTFLKFSIADFPGQINFTESSSTFDVGAIFGEATEDVASTCGAVIFVIDAQDDYYEALPRLYHTISTAYKINPNIFFEIFIHKVDGLSDELKIETQRDIHQRVTDELLDLGILDKIHISFYLTSIYDHSIYEAFSKVIQKLIPLLPTLENILNTLCSSSSIEKAFLFDSFTKIYLATDASPVDIQSYELSSDMIDVMIDLESIYAFSSNEEDTKGSCFQKKSDHQQGCVTRLSTGIVLCLVQMHKLSLVCLLRAENYDDKTGLLEFNFQKFRETLWNVFLIH